MNVNDIGSGPLLPFEPLRRRTGQAQKGGAEREGQHVPQSVGPRPPASSSAGYSPPVLTEEEGRFFEQAYPESAQDIRLRQSYSSTGQASGVVTGTLIDRKG